MSENVVLIVHLILALCLIGLVLVQRSEGGGLGMGGGGNVMSNRAAATALGKLTWGFAIAFIATSMTLTVFAAQNSGGSSVIEQIGGRTSGGGQPAIETLLPPTATGDGGEEGAPRAD